MHQDVFSQIAKLRLDEKAKFAIIVLQRKVVAMPYGSSPPNWSTDVLVEHRDGVLPQGRRHTDWPSDAPSDMAQAGSLGHAQS